LFPPGVSPWALSGRNGHATGIRRDAFYTHLLLRCGNARRFPVDNLTHSLIGYTLARAGLGRTTPAPTLTLVLASNVPDADIITALTGGGVSYLDAHRGLSHGPLGCLTLGALVAVGVVAGAFWRARRRGDILADPARALLGTLALAIFGAVLHVVMDIPTVYGTRVLSPFVDTWYALDWMPIIDAYLWTVLVGGVVWMRLRPAAARRVAILLLALTGIDYAVRGVLHEFALADASARTADALASPCVTSPTLVRHPTLIEAAIAGPESCIQSAALPTFQSPFTWRAVRQYPGGYELSDRRIGRRDPKAPRVWVPSEAGPLVARARATTTGRVFFHFSRFPAARIVQSSPDEVIVRIVDVRFPGTPLRWDQNALARSPFVVTVALDRAGRVKAEQLGN
jgi:membrane-bound metal-dependent hydrolase YbcI (DUF457 family)